MISNHRTTASERFLAAVSPYREVVVVTHDNPDPDAIAAGWGILVLVREKLGKKARLIGGGDIVRAENRHMVDLLRAPIELVDGMQCPRASAIVLVDCQLGNQNYLFCNENAPVAAVIDHHPLAGPKPRLPFHDIRPRVAASVTIVASYLKEQRLEPGADLATAMLFAIRTETRGSETYYSRLDRMILLWLTERADPSKLAEIENAPLTRAYYGDLILALQSTFIYGDTAFCLLPRASGPEIIGEVADLLIREESVWKVLCGAVVHGDLLLSVRTEHEQDDAAQLVREVLDGLGQGGGHRRRAGGKISGTGPGRKITEDLQDELRNRWLDVCGVDRQRGTRLVPLREIKQNL